MRASFSIVGNIEALTAAVAVDTSAIVHGAAWMAFTIWSREVSATRSNVGDFRLPSKGVILQFVRTGR